MDYANTSWIFRVQFHSVTSWLAEIQLTESWTLQYLRRNVSFARNADPEFGFPPLPNASQSLTETCLMLKAVIRWISNLEIVSGQLHLSNIALRIVYNTYFQWIIFTVCMIVILE